jgi:hypothetical protein
MTGFRRKRFDVAGAHPDEAWRAVSDAADVVSEVRSALQARGEMCPEEAVSKWLERKPMRYGNGRDEDVRRFLADGVELINEMGDVNEGFSVRQAQVRDRCHELAKSMEKVLAQRADEAEPFDPWRPVKIRVATEPPTAGARALTAGETRARYVLALKGCFPRGPAQADRARAQYRVWEQNAERFHKDGPMNEAAQSWKRFMGVIDNMRSREMTKGVEWGRVDDVTGIDFRPALTPRPAWQSKPRMRM